jgi:hypothetical protein
MIALAIFVTIVCYGLAGYLWYRQRAPIYLFALMSGHLSALATPLWRVLYGVDFSPSLETIQAIIGEPIPTAVLIASAWYYPLPAALVLYLFTTRWWFPGYLTSIITFLIFLLYHLLIETIGLRTNLWEADWPTLPLGLPGALLPALMAGLISYSLLYILLSTYRYALLSLILVVVPATLVLSLAVRGILGAPFWVTQLLGGAPWMLSFGLVSVIALLGWAVHIITMGISRVE